jgi:branched-chain amino acid transport system substrate-binding protein
VPRLRAMTLVAAATATLAVAAAGCGSSSSAGKTKTSGSATAAPTTSLPAGKCGALTKTPINLVDITDQTGIPGVPFHQFPDAEGAAVQYVNTNLCGVDGHPLKLIKCDSKYNPASTAACANGAVAAKPLPVAEIGLSVFLITEGSRILHQHGLITLNFPTQPQDIEDPDSFPLGGGTEIEFPAQAYFAATHLHAKHPAALLIDSPGAPYEYAEFQAAFRQAGIQTTVRKVLYPDATLNMTPFAVKAAAGSDVIMGNTSGPALNSVYRTLAQQGFSADKTINASASADAAPLAAAGPAANGAYFTAEFASPDDTTNPQVKLYRAAMAKYGPSFDARAELSEGGFANVMTLYGVMKKIGGDRVTAATVSAYFHKTPSIPIFLGASLISKAASKAAPALRNLAVTVLQWSGGKFNLVDGGKFFVPPTVR